MAQVLLVSTAGAHRDFWDDDHARVLRAAGQDKFKAHSLTADPLAADLIIFFEPSDPHLATDVRHHRYAKQFPDKAFLIDPSDRVIPFLCGIYASIERRHYDPARVRSGFFPVVGDYHWITYDPHGPPAQLLFSFVGDARSAPVREAIGRLTHPRAVIRNTSADPANAAGLPEESYERFRADYARVLRDSAFVLCPRGAGASTFRVFEAMKAGRAPVILSDEWVPPEGPDWDRFALIVRERDVEQIPRLLERHEHLAEAMGTVARQQWELWFSESVCFHRIVEWCLSIRRTRRWPERLMRRIVLWQLLTPFNFRRKLVPAVWMHRPR
jgi:hypothetical protein